MRKTQRTYTDTVTKEVFSLYKDDDTDVFALINDNGTRVNGWYLSAHSPMQIKLNTGKVVSLDRGEFYNTIDNEVVVAKKYAGFKRFTKI